MKVSRKLSLAALCLGFSGLLHAQSGTANGTYHFGGIGAANSGGTGLRTQGDKFLVTNIMTNGTPATTEMWAANGSTNVGDSMTIKVNGTSVQSFRLLDIALRNKTGNFPLKKFDVKVLDAYGNTIGAHSLIGTNQSMRDYAINISEFVMTPSWPAAGYPYAATLKINYEYVSGNRPPSDLRFINWTLADISNDAPPFVSTGSASGTYCAGGPISVGFASGMNFSSGNVYSLQLSDASGSFASPVTIGTLASNAASGSISGSIPDGTPEGSGYRVRVTGSAPAYTSLNDNGSNLTIHAKASALGVSNQVVCNGAGTAAVSFSGSSATGFTWTNDNPSIGIGASGSGDIASFTASNSSNSVQTGNFVLTPVNNGCDGTPVSFSISVNPTPSVNAVSNIEVCASSALSAAFSGAVSGTTYSWTNSNTAIGLPASGTGDISGMSANVSGQETATITVTTEAAGCAGGSTSFSVTVNPTPAASISYNGGSPIAERLGNASVTHSGTPGGSYSSTSGLSIDPATGAINLAASTPGTYTVTYTVAAAGGCSLYSTTTSVELLPFNASITYAGSPFCGSTGSGAVTRTGTPGGTYSSTSGLVIDPATGAIDIAASTAGTYTVHYTVGPDFVQAAVSIRPTTLINASPNQVLCANVMTSAVTLTGAPGLTFSWTNDNTSVGLAASGNDVVPAFPASNSGSTSSLATVTVTAAGGTGCDLRKLMIYRYTVKPIPSLGAISSQTLCAGTNTTAVLMSGPVAGTSYGWTNNNTTIGLGAFGTGDIAAFTSQNNTGSVQTANVTVTPQAAGCVGATQSFSYTVSPSAGSFSYPAASYCQAGVAAPTRAGSAGGTFSAPAGLVIDPATGSVNLAQSTPGNYTVTYSVSSIAPCSATAIAQINIKPSATVDAVANQVYCNNVWTSVLSFTGTPTTGVTYNWTSDNAAALGMPASGSNSIPSFKTPNTMTTIASTIRVTPISSNPAVCNGKQMGFRYVVNACTPTVAQFRPLEETTSFRLSPNPAQGNVTLQLDEAQSGAYSVQLLTQQGVPASGVASFTGRSYSINTSMLTPGAYFVQLVNLKTKEVIRKQLFKL